MKINKLVILLCIVFSFQSFSKGRGAVKGASQTETEAGFSFDCPHCENSPVLPFTEEQSKCLSLVHSEECRRIPSQDRKICTKKNSFKLADTSLFLSQCIKETALSFQFIFELLWYAISAGAEWMFDSEDNSSTQNYIYLEFYKVYRTTKGSRLERALKAAEVIGKEAFNLIYSNIKEFLLKEYKSFKCYNFRAQTTLACVFIAGLFVPVPGASFISILKAGAKGGAKFIKQPKATLNGRTKATQIKNIKKHIQSNFEDIKKQSLKKSKKLTKAQRIQIRQFFNRVDKEKFINLISNKLKKIDHAVLSRENIRNAVISSLTIGAAHTIQLSQKSVFTIAEGVTDTVAVEYINKELIKLPIKEKKAYK